jgi:hypothetical protein
MKERSCYIRACSAVLRRGPQAQHAEEVLEKTMQKAAWIFVVALLAGGLLSSPASATVITIDGNQFLPGQNSQTIGGLNWTSSPGKFVLKSRGGYTGVGITGGRTGDEIDIGEFLTATIGPGLTFSVPSFTLGVLFDGPEFNDVEEVAQVTIWSVSQGMQSFTLKNTYQDLSPPFYSVDLAEWSGLGTVSNLSPSVNSGGAVWLVENPFGSLNDIYKVQFTALKSDTCGKGPCTNQSDFTLVQFQYEPVPEPGTYAMLGAGLLVLGWLGRRRKTS